MQFAILMILCFCFSVLNFFCLTGWYDTKFFCKFVFGFNKTTDGLPVGGFKLLF